MNTLLVVLLPLRFIGLLFGITLGLITQILVLTWIEPRTTRHIIALWSRLMLRCLGVRLYVRNQLQDTVQDTVKNTVKNVLQPSSLLPVLPMPTALYVSNHVSWLDILALQAVVPVVFVAKHEIKTWPILGWLVRLAGTCFIDRSRRSALRSVHSALTAYLQVGQSICIFPEGTTTDGSHVLPFHSGLLQAAIDASVPVQPMHVAYSHTAAAYVNQRSLLSSALAVLLTPALQVRVSLLNPIPVKHINLNPIDTPLNTLVSSLPSLELNTVVNITMMTRQALAQKAQEAIAEAALEAYLI